MDKNLTIRDIIETDGLIYPDETRVITRLADQLLGVPATEFGLTGTDNAWTGDQTFDDITVDDLSVSGLSNLTAGLISGLTLSNNGTDATNDIDFAAGVASSSNTSLPVVMTLAAARTKQLDAAWAAGTNAGGRMSAAAIANTTYHCFLIRNPTTGVVDCGFDVSATAPTMPTGYTQYRRIGSIIRLAGAIVAFVQDGDYFTLGTEVGDYSSATTGITAVTVALTVPVGIRVRALGVISCLTTTVSTAFVWYVTDLSQPDVAPGGGTTMTMILETLATAGSYRNQARYETFTNTSASIRFRASVSNAATTFRVHTTGWVDTRGR